MWTAIRARLKEWYIAGAGVVLIAEIYNGQVMMGMGH